MTSTGYPYSYEGTCYKDLGEDVKLEGTSYNMTPSRSFEIWVL